MKVTWYKNVSSISIFLSDGYSTIIPNSHFLFTEFERLCCNTDDDETTRELLELVLEHRAKETLNKIKTLLGVKI